MLARLLLQFLLQKSSGKFRIGRNLDFPHELLAIDLETHHVSARLHRRTGAIQWGCITASGAGVWRRGSFKLRKARRTILVFIRAGYELAKELAALSFGRFLFGELTILEAELP